MEIKGKSIAIVGASNNPEKYGNKVIAAISKITNKIYPVNPKENEILGKKVFANVNDIKAKLDIVVFVIPPAVTLGVLESVKNKKVHFWFQPGSFDDSVISYCKRNGLSFTNDLCIIVESERISNEN